MEKQKSANSTRKVEDIFDAVKTQTLGKRSAESLKMQGKRISKLEYTYISTFILIITLSFLLLFSNMFQITVLLKLVGL